jgi:hypothetical protein
MKSYSREVGGCAPPRRAWWMMRPSAACTVIADAEQRYDRQLATRFVELTRDMTMQRRADMQNITRYVGQYDEQLLRQRQILNDQGRVLNNVIRVSSSPQQ